MTSDWWIFTLTLLVCCSFSFEKAIVNISADVAPVVNDVRTDTDRECENYVMAKEYVLLENGSLLLPNSDSVYGSRSFFVKNGTAFLCADESLPKSDSLYDVTQPEKMQQDNMHDASREHKTKEFSITYVNLVISIVSLLSHLSVFCVVSSVRDLPGCCLASLSLSLLMAYLCFLVSALLGTSDDFCAKWGICMYYFLLTTFFWMNAIAFDVWRSFREVLREQKITSLVTPWRRFLLYSIYSWLIPAMLTALVKVADSTDLLPKEYRPSFGYPICWFDNRKASQVFVVKPLSMMMFLNAVFLIDALYVITELMLKTTQTHVATLKKYFITIVSLALITGPTWILGVVARNEDIPILWYLFVFLSTLQGLFIFIVFLCSSNVRNICFDKFRKHS